MRPKEKIFDDIARVAGGTVNVLSGLKHNIEEDIKARVDEMAYKLDLVPREDLERLESQIDALEERIKKLENGAPNKKTPNDKRTK
jgi:BMFP domain-containing protein YqiC